MGKASESTEVLVGALRPYERNAKQHSPEQVEKIAASIREFGFLSPILIDRDMNIIAGHGRALAAEHLGMKTVPAVYIDGLTDEQRRAYILADNRLTELGDWNMDLVQAELADLEAAGFDIDLTGFELDIDTGSFDSVEEDAFEKDQEHDVNEHGVERGQVWICGEHRVMCGDATSKEDADKLMDGGLADMVFTDPPYGVAIGDKNKLLNEHVGNGRRGHSIEKNIEGDTLDTGSLYEMLKAAMSNLREHCTEECSYYVTSPQGGEIGLMMMMMRDAGLPVRHNLVWVKNVATFSLGRLDYDYRHEPIFYTWTKRHNFYGGYSNTVIDGTQDVDKMDKAELKETIRKLRMVIDGTQDSVIYEDKPLKCDLHPTMKPVKLVARFLLNSSLEGDTVADFFGGSGSTMIACEQLHRKARMMELDPHYVDVILTRWEELTGLKAVLA